MLFAGLLLFAVAFGGLVASKQEHSGDSQKHEAATGNRQLSANPEHYWQLEWRMEATAHIASHVMRHAYCQVEPETPCELANDLKLSPLMEWASQDLAWDRILSSLSLYEIGRRFWSQQEYERSLLATEQAIALKLFTYLDQIEQELWQKSLVTSNGRFKQPKLELADSLILRANCMYQLGRKSGRMDYMHGAFIAIHLASAMMYNSEDIEVDVLKHLDGLAFHLSSTSAEILTRIKKKRLMEMMEEYDIDCSWCQGVRSCCVAELIRELSLPLRFIEGTTELEVADNPFDSRAYTQQQTETHVQYKRRMFAQLASVVNSRIFSDIGVPRVLPLDEGLGRHSTFSTSYHLAFLPAWVMSQSRDNENEPEEPMEGYPFRHEAHAQWIEQRYRVAVAKGRTPVNNQNQEWEEYDDLPPDAPDMRYDDAVTLIDYYMFDETSGSASELLGTLDSWFPPAHRRGSKEGRAARQAMKGRYMKVNISEIEARAQVPCISPFCLRPQEPKAEPTPEPEAVAAAAAAAAASPAAAAAAAAPLEVKEPPCPLVFSKKLAPLAPLQFKPAMPPLPEPCCPSLRQTVDQKPNKYFSGAEASYIHEQRQAVRNAQKLRVDSPKEGLDRIPEGIVGGAPVRVRRGHSNPYPKASELTGPTASDLAFLRQSTGFLDARQVSDRQLQEALTRTQEHKHYLRDDPMVVIMLSGSTVALVLIFSITKHRRRLFCYIYDLSWPGSPATHVLSAPVNDGSSNDDSSEGTPFAMSSHQKKIVAAALRDAMVATDTFKLESALASAELAGLDTPLLQRANHLLIQRRKRDKERERASQHAAKQRLKEALKRKPKTSGGGAARGCSRSGGASTEPSLGGCVPAKDGDSSTDVGRRDDGSGDGSRDRNDQTNKSWLATLLGIFAPGRSKHSSLRAGASKKANADSKVATPGWDVRQKPSPKERKSHVSPCASEGLSPSYSIASPSSDMVPDQLLRHSGGGGLSTSTKSGSAEALPSFGRIVSKSHSAGSAEHCNQGDELSQVSCSPWGLSAEYTESPRGECQAEEETDGEGGWKQVSCTSGKVLARYEMMAAAAAAAAAAENKAMKSRHPSAGSGLDTTAAAAATELVAAAAVTELPAAATTELAAAACDPSTHVPHLQQPCSRGGTPLTSPCDPSPPVTPPSEPDAYIPVIAEALPQVESHPLLFPEHSLPSDGDTATTSATASATKKHNLIATTTATASAAKKQNIIATTSATSPAATTPPSASTSAHQNSDPPLHPASTSVLPPKDMASAPDLPASYGQEQLVSAPVVVGTTTVDNMPIQIPFPGPPPPPPPPRHQSPSRALSQPPVPPGIDALLSTAAPIKTTFKNKHKATQGKGKGRGAGTREWGSTTPSPSAQPDNSPLPRSSQPTPSGSHSARQAPTLSAGQNTFVTSPPASIGGAPRGPYAPPLYSHSSNSAPPKAAASLHSSSSTPLKATASLAATRPTRPSQPPPSHGSSTPPSVPGSATKQSHGSADTPFLSPRSSQQHGLANAYYAKLVTQAPLDLAPPAPAPLTQDPTSNALSDMLHPPPPPPPPRSIGLSSVNSSPYKKGRLTNTNTNTITHPTHSTSDNRDPAESDQSALSFFAHQPNFHMAAPQTTQAPPPTSSNSLYNYEHHAPAPPTIAQGSDMYANNARGNEGQLDFGDNYGPETSRRGYNTRESYYAQEDSAAGYVLELPNSLSLFSSPPLFSHPSHKNVWSEPNLSDAALLDPSPAQQPQPRSSQVFQTQHSWNQSHQAQPRSDAMCFSDVAHLWSGTAPSSTALGSAASAGLFGDTKTWSPFGEGSSSGLASWAMPPNNGGDWPGTNREERKTRASQGGAMRASMDHFVSWRAPGVHLPPVQSHMSYAPAQQQQQQHMAGSPSPGSAEQMMFNGGQTSVPELQAMRAPGLAAPRADVEPSSPSSHNSGNYALDWANEVMRMVQ